MKRAKRTCSSYAPYDTRSLRKRHHHVYQTVTVIYQLRPRRLDSVMECTHTSYHINMRRSTPLSSVKSLCAVIVFMAHVSRAEQLVKPAFGMMPCTFFTNNPHWAALTASSGSSATLKLGYCRCYSPTIKRQFQLYTSSVDNNPDCENSSHLQTTGLRGLASQIDSKFKSSWGSSTEEQHSRMISPRYGLGVLKWR